MEMPEGLKRFAIATDRTSDECYEQYDCEMACELLKEMAEALDAVDNRSSGCYSKVYEVLKKFKEWK